MKNKEKILDNYEKDLYDLVSHPQTEAIQKRIEQVKKQIEQIKNILDLNELTKLKR